MNRERANPDAVSEGARIQTFLIADVRGYTLFTQQRGDEAAAKLAAKFAEIARETVQRFAGDVIELRGDEALAVFSSARQAVRAAVDLQERFVEETVAEPDLPMPVGIGLDAGEAVPLEGGYRGGALNLAARLCGQARAGEILASRGVTHLARRVDGVRFLDRGTVRLKNLPEPVELVRILPEGSDPAERLRAALPPQGPPRRRGAFVLVAAVVAIALAVAAAIVLIDDDTQPAIAAGSVGLLDPSGSLEGSVEVGELPRGVAFGAGALWVTDQQTRTLVRVDPGTLRVDERIPVGAGPTGVTTAAGFVWVANTDDRTISVVDPQAHRVVDTIVVGNGPAGIVFDGDRVWVANSVDATVSEIDAVDGRVVAEHPVGERPVSIAAGEGAVWVANQLSGTVSRVVPGEGETETIPVGRGPAAIVFAADALWVANAEDATVTKIDPATRSVTGVVERVGGDPLALAAGGGDIWVANGRGGTITRIDPVTAAIAETYVVGNEPRTLTGAPDGVWVGVGPSPAVHRGGTLTVVSESGVGSVDPADFDLVGSTVLASTYDGLVTYRRAGGAAGLTVVPDLAVSIPVPTDGGRTYTFRLREGIRFSNGDALTPQDVVTTFERVLTGRQAYGRYLLPELVGASTCTPKDPEACDLSDGVVADQASGTVTFHLVRPAPDFLMVVATTWFSIVPEDTPIDLEGEPVPATGPYQITQIGEDGSLVLERNPEFREWSADAQPAGFADRIELIVGVSTDDQVDMVDRGEADLGLDGVPAGRLEELDRRASDQLVRSPFIAIGAFSLNTEGNPFDDVDARRAVAFAIDRGQLARIYAATAAFPLENPVHCQVIPPNLPGYAPYCPFTTPGAEVPGSWVGPDLTRARALIRRSGTVGDEVVVALTVRLEATGEALASTLRDLGYRVELRIADVEDASLPRELYTPDVDVSFTGWVQDYPSPANFLVPLLSCGSSVNFSNFCDPEIDRRMQRALDLQLTDPHAAARAFEELDRDLVDLAPLVPYETGISISFVSERVSNVQYNPQLGVLLSQMWIR